MQYADDIGGIVREKEILVLGRDQRLGLGLQLKIGMVQVRGEVEGLFIFLLNERIGL